MLTREMWLNTKRIICPKCKGEKVLLLPIENTNQLSEQLCPVCDGEGIVFERKEILSLKHANEARK